MGNIIFASDYSGYEILHNNKEPLKLDGQEIDSGRAIAKFSPYRVFDEQKGQVVLKGYLILDEGRADTIEFLRKYPAVNRDYKETKILPQQTNTVGSIVTGVVPPSNEINLKSLAQETKDKTISLMNRFYELKQKLFKRNGDPREDADEAELQEFNELTKELNQ